MDQEFRDFKVYVQDLRENSEVDLTFSLERFGTQEGTNALVRQLSIGFPAPEYKIEVYEMKYVSFATEDWVLIN